MGPLSAGLPVTGSEHPAACSIPGPVNGFRAALRRCPACLIKVNRSLHWAGSSLRHCTLSMHRLEALFGPPASQPSLNTWQQSETLMVPALLAVAGAG